MRDAEQGTVGYNLDPELNREVRGCAYISSFQVVSSREVDTPLVDRNGAEFLDTKHTSTVILGGEKYKLANAVIYPLTGVVNAHLALDTIWKTHAVFRIQLQVVALVTLGTGPITVSRANLA